MKKKRGRDFYVGIGSKGGQKTAGKGKRYMSKIGRRGAKTTNAIWKLLKAKSK